MKSIKNVFGLVLYIYILIMGVLIYSDDKYVLALDNTSYIEEQNQELISSIKTSKIKKINIDLQIEKQVKLSWESINNADGYYIYRASKKNGKYKVVGNVKKAYYKDKTVKKKRTYYYRVQAYKLIQDQIYSGKKSKKIEVFVRPKHPKMAVVGECFVEGMKGYSKSYFPKGARLFAKVGMFSWFLNDGRGGEASASNIAVAKPERLYVLIGVNEAKNSSPKTSTNNFYKTYKKIAKNNPGFEMVVIAIPPTGRYSKLNIASPQKREVFLAEYKRFASKHKHIYYCDATEVLNDGSGYLSRSYDAGDGCHWSGAGTIKVMKSMKEWSLKNLGSW